MESAFPHEPVIDFVKRDALRFKKLKSLLEALKTETMGLQAVVSSSTASLKLLEIVLWLVGASMRAAFSFGGRQGVSSR